MGYRLLVAWMVDVGEDSAVLSASNKLCALAHHKIAVRNERLKRKEKLPWETHAARQAWASSGGLEGSIPGLTKRVAARLRDIKNAPFSTMIEDQEHLAIIERQAIKRWVNTAWACGIEPLYRAALGVDHG